MIISHKHKFIFLKTEKTAGTSIEIALSKICGSDDIITPISKPDELYRKVLGFRGAQNYKFPVSSYKTKQFSALFQSKSVRKTKLGFYNHISASEAKKHLSKVVWKDYFKFCFERNPFDKFVSWYHWRNKEGKYPSMRAFIESGEAFAIKAADVYSPNGVLEVDKIYKFEALDEAIADLNERFHLAGALALPDRKTKERSEKKVSYRMELTDFEIEWIKHAYLKEIVHLGYAY